MITSAQIAERSIALAKKILLSTAISNVEFEIRFLDTSARMHDSFITPFY